jgi:hypothetical protein
MTERNTMTTHKAQEAAEAPAPQAAPAAPALRHPDVPASAICGIQAHGRGGLCVLYTDASIWFTDDLGATWTEVVPASVASPEAARKAR